MTRPSLPEFEKNVILKAMEAGFMLSTAHGQSVDKLMPVSDKATLVKFWNLAHTQGRDAGIEAAAEEARKYRRYARSHETTTTKMIDAILALKEAP